MRAHDVAACVLFNEPNIRCATGASAMPMYAMSTFVRCAVVPQEGQPHPLRARELRASVAAPSARRPPDARRGSSSTIRLAEAGAWAQVTVAALRELGVTGDLVAVDALGRPRASRCESRWDQAHATRDR